MIRDSYRVSCYPFLRNWIGWFLDLPQDGMHLLTCRAGGSTFTKKCNLCGWLTSHLPR